MPQPGQEAGFVVSLDMEIPVEDTNAFLSFGFNVGTNSKGQKVPIPQLNHGDKVPVLTILRRKGSLDGGQAVINWTYEAPSKSLRLKIGDEGNNIPLSTGATRLEATDEWYVAGAIGMEYPNPIPPGTAIASRLQRWEATGATRYPADGLQFEGSTVLHGVDTQNEGATIPNLKVPYAFAWTRVYPDANGNGVLGENVRVKFKPLGALIGFRIKNSASATRSLTPKHFTITSNAYHRLAFFPIFNRIGSVLGFVTPGSLSWTHPHLVSTRHERAMVYTFDPATAPEALAPGETSPLTYYAWVAPNDMTRLANIPVQTSMTVNFEDTGIPGDMTNAYYTSYTPNATSGGRVENGKVYSMIVEATDNIRMPAQYATAYNIAGGELPASQFGGTYPKPVSKYISYIQRPEDSSSTPTVDEGMRGPLRFANRDATNPTTAENDDPHRNDRSGYYGMGKLFGLGDPQYNEYATNLLDEHRAIDQDGTELAKLSDKYRLPEMDEWSRLLGASNLSFSSTTATLSLSGVPFRIYRGSSREPLLRFGTDAYKSNGSTIMYGVVNGRTRATVFPSNIVRVNGYYKEYGKPNGGALMDYTPMFDDSERGAFRATLTTHGGSQALGRRLVVDYAYLGNEPSQPAVDASLTTIASEIWWAQKKAEGKVITLTFPLAGVISDVHRDTPAQEQGGSYTTIHSRGGGALYHSAKRYLYYMGANAAPNSLAAEILLAGIRGGAGGQAPQATAGSSIAHAAPQLAEISYGLALRLFYKDL